MAVNYAEKYASQVDERFRKMAYTSAIVNSNYDFVGVETVKVFSRDLATLNDYKLTGANRYGTPDELGNEVQEMKVTQDKSFTYTIDAKSEQDTNGTMEAGATLRENIDNVIIPAVDKYRISVLVAAAPTVANERAGISASHVITKAVTNANAFDEFLEVQNILDEDDAPVGGRIALVTPGFLKKIRLDDNFSKDSDVAMYQNIRGFAGTIDGTPTIKMAAKYFPANVDFVITNPIVMTSPVKLSDYIIHYNPPGINGALIEGRVRYDAFALDMKKGAIGVHKSAASG